MSRIQSRQVVTGPAEWLGTKIRFELKQEDDFTIVLFKHEGWKEPVEFMHHCSTKWAVFLMSLKSLGETGKGQPTRTTSRSATGTDTVARGEPLAVSASGDAVRVMPQSAAPTRHASGIR